MTISFFLNNMKQELIFTTFQGTENTYPNNAEHMMKETWDDTKIWDDTKHYIDREKGVKPLGKKRI